jgi:hypothetical protein
VLRTGPHYITCCGILFIQLPVDPQSFRNDLVHRLFDWIIRCMCKYQELLYNNGRHCGHTAVWKMCLLYSFVIGHHGSARQLGAFTLSLYLSLPPLSKFPHKSPMLIVASGRKLGP